MISVRGFLAGAAVAGLLTAASAANATTIDIHAVGTVDSGSEWNALFPGTGDLGGLSFVYDATYVLHPNAAHPNIQDFGSSDFSGVLKIGANTLNFGGAPQNTALLWDGIKDSSTGELFNLLTATTHAAPPSQNPVKYDLQLVTDNSGLLLLSPPYGDLCAGGRCADGLDVLSRTSGFDPIILFDLTHLVVSPEGGVPEPSAWALMLLGFGAVGALGRRRRVEGAAAA